MNPEQLSTLWAFRRGDLEGPLFETWYFCQPDLEELLGCDLYLSLLGGNYADRETVWQLRQLLAAYLDPLESCECFKIRDFYALPMGGDFYFDKVFASLGREIEYGPDKWWLYIVKCHCCATVWLIAQDDRIYDEFFFLRIDEEILERARQGDWPTQFTTYESVLRAGMTLSNPPRFLDPMAASLQWSVEDLQNERADIQTKDVAELLGVTVRDASRLMDRAGRSRLGAQLSKWWNGS